MEILARDLGVLNRNFFLLEPGPKEDMPAVLAAATIAAPLFIDLAEMWANSAKRHSDALASGTPVAINHSGWQAEILEGEGAGVVLYPHDHASAARSLIERVRDPAWQASAGDHALRVASERFDPDKLALELERVLLDAVSGEASTSRVRARAK